MNENRQVFLYPFDKNHVLIPRYQFVNQYDLTVTKLLQVVDYLLLQDGVNEVVAVDNYPALRIDYNRTIRSNDPQDIIAFHDTVSRSGMTFYKEAI